MTQELVSAIICKVLEDKDRFYSSTLPITGIEPSRCSKDLIARAMPPANNPKSQKKILLYGIMKF